MVYHTPQQLYSTLLQLTIVILVILGKLRGVGAQQTEAQFVLGRKARDQQAAMAKAKVRARRIQTLQVNFRRAWRLISVRAGEAAGAPEEPRRAGSEHGYAGARSQSLDSARSVCTSSVTSKPRT